MELYEALADDSLLFEPQTIVGQTSGAPAYESKYDQFVWARYDWSKFDPAEYGYNVIRLVGDESNKRRRSVYSGVYFTVVDLCHYDLLTCDGQRWYPHIEPHRDRWGRSISGTIKRITAHRNTGPRSTRRVEYLHRLIADVEGIKVGDHINGLPLDNRDCNLRPVSFAVNNSNKVHARPVNSLLLPGVETLYECPHRVRACTQIGGVRYRSKEIWNIEDQHLAHQWYQAKRMELFGEHAWVNGETTVEPIRYPPPNPNLDYLFSEVA